MHSVPEKTTIVIAGAFNPAILTPQWIGKNAIDPPIEDNLPVFMMAPIVATGIAQNPRFSFADLSYTPNFQNVTFYIEDESRGQRVCNVAASILRLLPHTPVTGIGLNFGYTDDQPSIKLLQLLQMKTSIGDALGDGAEVVGRRWANLVNWGDSLLTVQCEINAGNLVTTDFNFHYTVQSASAAETVLQQQDVFARHKSGAERVVAELMNEASI